MKGRQFKVHEGLNPKPIEDSFSAGGLYRTTSPAPQQRSERWQVEFNLRSSPGDGDGVLKVFEGLESV